MACLRSIGEASGEPESVSGILCTCAEHAQPRQGVSQALPGALRNKSQKSQTTFEPVIVVANS